MTWVIKCSGKDAMKAVGRTTYRGERLEGTIPMTSNDPEEGRMHMTTHISGRRIGKCN